MLLQEVPRESVEDSTDNPFNFIDQE